MQLLLEFRSKPKGIISLLLTVFMCFSFYTPCFAGKAKSNVEIKESVAPEKRLVDLILILSGRFTNSKGEKLVEWT